MEGPEERPYYLTPNDVTDWLKLHYKLGKQGHMAKSTIYSDYLELCEDRGAKPIISPTFFGKLVKRAFPGIQSVRKGPRGQVRQCYARLKKRKKPLTSGGPPDSADCNSPTPGQHYQHSQLQPTASPPIDLAHRSPQLPHSAPYPQYYPHQFHPSQYLPPPHPYGGHGLAAVYRTEVDRHPQQHFDHHPQQQLEMVQQHLKALRGRVKEEQEFSASGGGATGIEEAGSEDRRGSGRSRGVDNYGSPGRPTNPYHHQNYSTTGPSATGQLRRSVSSSSVAEGYGSSTRGIEDAPTAQSSPLLSSSLSSSSTAYAVLPPLQSTASLYGMPPSASSSHSLLHHHSFLYTSASFSPAHDGMRHDEVLGSTQPRGYPTPSSMSALGNFPYLPTASSATARPATPNYHLDSSSPHLLPSPTLPPPSPLLTSFPSSSSITPSYHQPHAAPAPSPPGPLHHQQPSPSYYRSPDSHSPRSSPSHSQAPPATLLPPLAHSGGYYPRLPHPAGGLLLGPLPPHYGALSDPDTARGDELPVAHSHQQ